MAKRFFFGEKLTLEHVLSVSRGPNNLSYAKCLATDHLLSISSNIGSLIALWVVEHKSFKFFLTSTTFSEELSAPKS